MTSRFLPAWVYFLIMAAALATALAISMSMQQREDDGDGDDDDAYIVMPVPHLTASSSLQGSDAS